MDRSNYLAEAGNHLSNSSTYKEVKFGEEEPVKVVEQSNRMFKQLLCKKLPSKLGKMAGSKKLPSHMYYLMAVWRQKFQHVFFVVSIIKSHKQMLKCFLQVIFIVVTH